MSWAEIANPRIKLLKKKCISKVSNAFIKGKRETEYKSISQKQGSTEEKIQSRQDVSYEIQKIKLVL